MTKLSTDEQKVIDSLSKPEWDYRTILGVAKETGLTEVTVRSILESKKDVIKESIIPSKNGERLFTLAKNTNALRDLWTAFKTINKEKF